MNFRILLLLMSSIIVPFLGWGQLSVISSGDDWRYYDQGDVGTSGWNSVSFNDANWSEGPSQLGYGDGDEATVLGYGGDANNKQPTTYFRKSFTVTNASNYTSLIFDIVYDDGAVIYLNGNEVTRQNMPAGNIAYATWSAGDQSSETTVFRVTTPATGLQDGNNVIAVEIHQSNGGSSDISMDMDLTLSSAAAADLIRGPYLQLGTQNSMVVKWRTASTSNSEVRYGYQQGTLTYTATDNTSTSNHQVTLPNLTPDTKYYYAIYSGGQLLKGDGENYFWTAPVPGTAKKTRVWIIGDSGTKNNNARSVRNAYYNYTDTVYTDVWLMLGDNAYDNGTDGEHQIAIFENMYETMLQITPVWPTVGNHERYGSTNSLNQTGTHFDIWTLPANGQFGGEPSGTEAYYSFDYGRIHFINLNSTMDIMANNSARNAMMNWAQTDLENTTQDWIIAYWHHPPYTKGSHDSDDDGDSNGQMQEMRTLALPIMETNGVDLVFTGHSHAYERSFFIDGHYGYSSQFASNPGNYTVDGGDGRQNGDGAYQKQKQANDGAVYVVAGSSGQASGGSLNHPAMFLSLNEMGSVVVDVDGGQLDATFINSQEQVRDYFTIIKTDVNVSVGKSYSPPLKSAFSVRFPSKETIEISVVRDGKYRLELLNLAGKILIKKKGKHNQAFVLSTKKFAPGKYVVRLTSGKKRFSRQITLRR